MCIVFLSLRSLLKTYLFYNAVDHLCNRERECESSRQKVNYHIIGNNPYETTPLYGDFSCGVLFYISQTLT